MTTDDVPDAVRALVNIGLPSMDHVEALLLVQAEPDVDHTIAAIATAACLNERIAAKSLDDLVSAGLVARTHDGYRYRATRTKREAVEQLVDLYHTRPVTLMGAIHARPAPIKSYADAFRPRSDNKV